MYLGPTKVDYTEVAAVSGHFEPPICIHNVQAAQSLRQLPPLYHVAGFPVGRGQSLLQYEVSWI